MKMTEAQEFMTPTKGVNSSKFNINHGHFITNLENQESPSKLGAYTPGKYSTSRVIESLHKQIDELTSTNLKMTSQCHQLVNELESSGKKQNKQLETISRLQTENMNLNAILDRKTNRMNELESSLKKQTVSNEDVAKKNLELEETIKKLSLENEKLTEQSTLYKIQYEAIVDAHQSYKKFFTNETNTLRNDLMSLKQSMTKQLESKTKEVLVIDEKIQNKLESLDSAQESFKKHASEQIEDNIKELRLDSWQSSLREAQALLKEYKSQAQAEGITIQEQPKASIPQLRNPKRKTSGQKRTSFYGTPTGFSIPSNKQTPPSSSSTQLPGLKRASSIRIPSDPNRNR
ncbi:She3 [Kluyveromyces lactis]|nr:She3 [Kluyveromyces lactis]